MATQTDIADHLGITQPAVAALVRSGVIPAAARGNYDLDAARLAYCAHLREQAAGRAGKPGAALDLSTERARFAAAQAEGQERKNAVARGELVVFADIDANVRGVLGLVTACLDRLPARLAGGDHKLRARIEKELNDARHELARMPVVPMDPAEDEDDDDAA